MRTIVYACLCLLGIALFTQCNSGGSGDGSADSTSVATDTSTAPGSTAGFKIGAQMWTFRLFTLAQALDKADSAGIKHIEAFHGQKLGGDMKGSFGVDMSAADRGKLKQLLQSKGISIVAMGVISPQTPEEWKKNFDLAKEFNLSYITSEPVKSHWSVIDSLAGVYGIKVAIHDHPKPNAYWHPDSVLAAIEGHPNIGACADVGHWARNGLNPADCLKKLEGHVYGVHLKDIVKFDQTNAADTVVGKGVIEFAPIFKELKRQNFNGMFSIEHESNWENNLPDVIATVKYYNDQVDAIK
ncbi:sugar phosphate isomerase/epimerase family protein [Foetidibacter luteolus]|uniref:sugar phosphate isomerase/epimerase family protein n=1 Tax=Foetidibacter luteolus TaxID=2608880 RepID=UPI00129B28D3|nr:sugar phosphate isomerase/epimerase [Foetidibacter luteolus]